MKRLFLISDDKDFTEWIEEELAEYGRFVRSLDSLDFFFPQWNASGSVDVIILPETVIESEETFLKLYEAVKFESPDTKFLFIYHREEDHFLQKLNSMGNICISYSELETGLMEERLLQHSHNASPRVSVQQQTSQKESAPITEPPITEPPESELPKTERTEPIVDLPNHDVNIEMTQKSPIKDNDQSQQKPEISPTGLLKKDQSEEPEYGSVKDMPQKRKKSSEEQSEKLQRIKERIIIEEKIVTVHVPVHYSSLLISVMSLYPRAGSTFVVSNFARLLGENKVPVAVLEPPSPKMGSTFYELMYGDKNAPKDWKSWSEQLQEKKNISQDVSWNLGGVNWLIAGTKPIANWNEDKTLQLLIAARRFPVTICDISSGYDDPISQKIMSMSDEIWVVADGDPVQLSHHYKTIDKLKADYPEKKLKAIGNKWNSFIKKDEWKEAVLLPILSHVPDLGDIVIKYLWNGQMAWDDSKQKNVLSDAFKPMIRAVIGKEMYSLFKKQYGFKAKIRKALKLFTSLDDETKTRRI